MNLKPLLLASALALSPTISYADDQESPLCFSREKIENLTEELEFDRREIYRSKTIYRYIDPQTQEFVELYYNEAFTRGCVWKTTLQQFGAEATLTLCFKRDEFDSLMTNFARYGKKKDKRKTIEIYKYPKAGEFVHVYSPIGVVACIWDTNSDIFESTDLEGFYLGEILDQGIYDLEGEKRLARKICLDYEIAQTHIRTMMILYKHIDELVEKAEADRPELPTNPEDYLDMTEEDFAALLRVDSLASIVVLKEIEDLIDDDLDFVKRQYNECKDFSEVFGLPEPIYHEYLRDIDYDHSTLNFEETNQ